MIKCTDYCNRNICMWDLIQNVDEIFPIIKIDLTRFSTNCILKSDINLQCIFNSVVVSFLISIIYVQSKKVVKIVVKNVTLYIKGTLVIFFSFYRQVLISAILVIKIVIEFCNQMIASDK